MNTFAPGKYPAGSVNVIVSQGIPKAPKTWWEGNVKARMTKEYAALVDRFWPMTAFLVSGIKDDSDNRIPLEKVSFPSLVDLDSCYLPTEAKAAIRIPPAEPIWRNSYPFEIVAWDDNTTAQVLKILDMPRYSGDPAEKVLFTISAWVKDKPDVREIQCGPESKATIEAIIAHYKAGFGKLTFSIVTPPAQAKAKDLGLKWSYGRRY